jgi:hypothetical protein
MSIQISFSEAFQYSDGEDGITLRVVLTSGDRIREAYAKVDAGAAVCLFSQEIGVLLGLDIERGIPLRLETLTGPLDTFGHEITIQTGALAFQTVVYFSKHPGLSRNFLGRQGWLRNLRLGIVDYENMLYLNRYDS